MKAKKLLSVILCIAMVLSTMSFTAFADEPDVIIDGEAYTGDASNLEEAIAAAQTSVVINGGTYEVNNYENALTIKTKAEITINGGTFRNPTWVGIFIENENSSVTINGGHFNANVGIKLRNSELTINGGTFNTGTVAWMDNGGAITVTNGQLVSKQNLFMGDSSKIDFQITGGSFEAGEKLTTSQIDENSSIEGGTFKIPDTDKKWTDYIHEDYAPAKDDSGVVELVKSTVKLTSGSKTKGYTSLQDAIDAATKGDTIEVLTKTIELPVIKKAGLTFKSTVGTQITNKIDNTNPDYGWKLEGTTFDGFEFTQQIGLIGKDLKILNCKFTGPNGIYYGDAGGTWYIEGCEFNCQAYGLQFGGDTKGGVVNVTDCTFYGGFNTFGTEVNFTNCEFTKGQAYSVVQTWSKMTLTGCTFDETWPTPSNGGNVGGASKDSKDAIVEIYNTTYAGGTMFDLNDDCEEAVFVVDPIKDGNGKYTGGTFAAEPDASYLADNFAAVERADGKWGVFEKSDENMRVLTLSSDKADETGVTELKAGETVTITVTYNGYKQLARAWWKLNYNPALFDCAEAETAGVINTTKIANTGEEFKYGEKLASYTFTAKKQTEVKTGEFSLSDAYTSTTGESNEDKCVIPGSNTVEVKIILDNYNVAVLVDGETQENGELEIKFDGKPHKVEVISTPAANKVDYTVYKLNDNGTRGDKVGDYINAPVIADKGNYEIVYTVTPKAGEGVDKATGSFKLYITSPVYAVEAVEDFVRGKTLLLVYTNVAESCFIYDGNPMVDVSASGYWHNDVSKYDYVFATVVDGVADATVDTYMEGKLEDGVRTACTVPVVSAYDCNINNSPLGTVDEHDLAVIYAVYNVRASQFVNSYMANIVKSDINGDKIVDGHDIAKVINAVYPIN